VVGSGDKDKSASGKTVSITDKGKKVVVAEKDVIDVEETDSLFTRLVKTYGSSVAKRLRSRSGKVVPSVPKAPVVEQVKKPAKKTMYGPLRPRSRFETPVVQKKQLKRKVVESDSDFEDEVSVTKGEASGGASVGRKSVGGKKVPANVPEVAIDNISFHLPSCVGKWKYVVQRRVALERELGKEALECTYIVSLIEEAGMIKIVWGLGDCYEQLVREFIVNVPEDCDNPGIPCNERLP
jgi:hypothetical protein